MPERPKSPRRQSANAICFGETDRTQLTRVVILISEPTDPLGVWYHIGSRKTLGIWGMPKVQSSEMTESGRFSLNVWSFRHSEPRLRAHR